MKRILCLFFIAAGINTQAQVCFGTPKAWNVSNSMSMLPTFICAADFTGDGLPDLVTGDVNNPYITLLQQQPGPVFYNSQDYFTGNTPEGVVAGDFNRDGLQDVAVANFGTNSVSIMQNTGGGVLNSNTSVSVTNPQFLASSDLSGDNFPDLVISSHTTPQIWVSLNDGTGHFPFPVSYSVTGSPSYVAIADFNQDGNKDLAVGVGTGIDVLLGTAGGTFNSSTNFPGLGWDVAIGDFNNDGKLDMAGSPKQAQNISVYLGNGSGSFAAATTFTTATDANSVTAGDFNNDGNLDLSVTHQAPTSQLSILQGDGAGNFSVVRTMSYPFVDPRKSIAVDIDQDGKTDIAVADAQDMVVTLLQSTVPTVSATASAAAVCQGSTVTLSGAGASSYAWSNGVTDGVAFTPTATVNYTVTGTDANGCTNTDTITVGILSPPSVTAASTATYVCSGNSVILTGGGALSYTWTGGVTNGSPKIITTTQTFTVSGTGSNGCVATATIMVAVRPAPSAPSICEVTADSLSINNVILWDKTLYPSADSFYIYRDTANYNYALVGVVPYSALSQYSDTARHVSYTVNGNPKVTYYKYKLAYKDSCGNMSPMSPYHQSVYMYNSSGLFQWNHYEIENQPIPVPGLTQYRLMRDNFATGTYTLAAGASASSTLISDPNYSSYVLTADWRIETQWNIACNPSLMMGPNGTQSTVVKSKSNISNNRTTGINHSGVRCVLYPNPTSDWLTVEVGSQENMTARIYDTNGVLMHSQSINGKLKIDVSALPAGVYSLNVVGKDHVSRSQFVVLR